MTVQEFKNDHPEYAHLEGDELWDLMGTYKLRQQDGEAIIRQTLPFWKRYRLRWLFYRQPKNWRFGRNDYSASQRCKSCRKGVSGWIGIGMGDRIVSYCPHCTKELYREPNTSFSHYAYKVLLRLVNAFYLLLDRLHIVRTGSRYGIFGDESGYVKYFSYHLDGRETFELRSRKWWEYIIIKK
jgi:hypothetical protein